MPRLTVPMRVALELAGKQELRRIFDSDQTPPWPVPAATLAALVRHGLLQRTERNTRHQHRTLVWTITPAGRAALQPRDVFRTEPIVYLAHAIHNVSGDYTTDPRRRIDEAPVTDPASLDSAWAEITEERHHVAQNKRRAATRLARSLRAA